MLMLRLISTVFDLYDRHSILKPPAVRIAIALAWTVLLAILLVQPSSQPLIGPPAPPGQPSLEREIALTIGHIGGFSILVGLWWWALLATLPARRALLIAVSGVLLFGLITEVAQVFSANRSPSVFDLVVNWAVTLGVGAGIRAYQRAARER
jgi:VanZ family protein